MVRAPHILVVDDDPKIRNGIARFLALQGLRVTTAGSGREMRDRLGSAHIDLAVLDIMLPDDDGLTLLREMRAASNLPVILLTAVAGETDRIVGLELGADDYLCKPFSLRELLARIRVVLRRVPVDRATGSAEPSLYAFEGWRFDARARTLTAPSGGYVELTTGEFELLLAFVDRPNRVLSRDQLLDLARGRSTVTFDRAMDVQVMRLRRKIEADPQSPLFIKTVRNGGYVFTPAVSRRDEA